MVNSLKVHNSPICIWPLIYLGIYEMKNYKTKGINRQISIKVVFSTLLS